MPRDAWNSGIRVNIQNTVDTRKIQALARKAAANILVGFPSGMQHVPTFHKNAEGEYRTLDGGKIEDVEPVETAELPPRPFLEEGIGSRSDELAEALKTEAKKVIDGGQANWNKVGTMAVGAIQEFVRGDYYRTNVPNSEKTIEYKGSDKPLIDGGNLIQSLQFIVQDGGD